MKYLTHVMDGWMGEFVIGGLVKYVIRHVYSM